MQSKKTFSQLKAQSQKEHISKASKSIVAVLEVIAPGDTCALWEAVKNARLVDDALSVENADQSETIYLRALAETYEHAIGWETRRQVLSIMVELVPFSKLQEYLPGIPRDRVTPARHHIKKYRRGVPLPTARSTTMRIDYSQLDHFLSFLARPHVIQDLLFGQRYLYLSGGKILETPNVIQTMVNERVIDQCQQYCLETNFKPFSASSMQRTLVSCSATTWSVPFHFPFALHLLTVDPITPGPSMQEILHSASYNTCVVLVELHSKANIMDTLIAMMIAMTMILHDNNKYRYICNDSDKGKDSDGDSSDKDSDSDTDTRLLLDGDGDGDGDREGDGDGDGEGDGDGDGDDKNNSESDSGNDSDSDSDGVSNSDCDSDSSGDIGSDSDGDSDSDTDTESDSASDNDSDSDCDRVSESDSNSDNDSNQKMIYKNIEY
ncbi:hypothetical protein AWC38_SpisGene11612 [Stylophora pistillata]|uniref:Uncharacterized protein n=1 Tax=Stylophora pistillata TaxID=50429 RepID=A0A2B4S5I1_STYPI|nr:hypothetical protein AWC38_SpisGene11612 [Stylophora pistillata]